jgi:GTP-binding protein Era
MSEQRTRAGFAAIVGAPNAGKSTLVNALVGSKVSIVSPKVQTTRMRVIGIAMTDLPGMAAARRSCWSTQPGIFRIAKRRLERAMVAAAWQGAEDADVVALVVDAERGVGQETQAIVERLKEQRAPRYLILNKIDLVEREKLLTLTADLNARLPFERTFMVSALKQDGIKDILATLAAALPESRSSTPRTRRRPAVAPAGGRGDARAGLPAAPPGAALRGRGRDREVGRPPDGSARIEQIIHVQREGQRAIVLGKGGARSSRSAPAPATSSPDAGAAGASLPARQGQRALGRRSAHYRAIGLDYEP